jgi:hypothetical protein
MDVSLQQVEENIAETWRHIDRQRSIIAILQEHGHLREVPTAEVLLQTLTVSLELLCERKALLLDGMQPPAEPGIEMQLDPG